MLHVPTGTPPLRTPRVRRLARSLPPRDGIMPWAEHQESLCSVACLLNALTCPEAPRANHQDALLQTFAASSATARGTLPSTPRCAGPEQVLDDASSRPCPPAR